VNAGASALQRSPALKMIDLVTERRAAWLPDHPECLIHLGERVSKALRTTLDPLGVARDWRGREGDGTDKRWV